MAKSPTATATWVVIESNTSKAALLDYWQRGWQSVFAALEPLRGETWKRMF